MPQSRKVVKVDGSLNTAQLRNIESCGLDGRLHASMYAPNPSRTQYGSDVPMRGTIFRSTTDQYRRIRDKKQES